MPDISLLEYTIPPKLMLILPPILMTLLCRILPPIQIYYQYRYITTNNDILVTRILPPIIMLILPTILMPDRYFLRQTRIELAGADVCANSHI